MGLHHIDTSGFKLPRIRVARAETGSSEFLQLRAVQQQQAAELRLLSHKLTGALDSLITVRRSLRYARAMLKAMQPALQSPATLLRSGRTDSIANLVPDAALMALRAEVAARTGICEGLICGPQRHAPLIAARRIFAREASDMGFSRISIGLALGCRDASTVGNLLRKDRAARAGGAV